MIDVKKIKARVDSHWNGAVPLRGLQRTNSLRATAKSTATTASNGTAAAAPAARLTRSRIGTTATLQNVRYITTKSVKSPEKLVAPALVRRQESNLTRKSLTKLREKQEEAKQVKQNDVEKLIAKVKPISHSQKMLCQVRRVALVGLIKASARC